MKILYYYGYKGFKNKVSPTLQLFGDYSSTNFTDFQLLVKGFSNL